METIIKVISVFLGLFVIANGVGVVYYPPYGDEPLGMVIIAIGIFIPILTLIVAKMTERSYD
jgi:hypothetical protein